MSVQDYLKLPYNFIIQKINDESNIITQEY